MAVREQQGGDGYFHLGLQPDDDTLIEDVQEIIREKKAFVEHSLEPTGEQRQSDSIRGSIFPSKSQAGRLGGTGRVVTELFRNSMLPYIQGTLNADPDTQSEVINATDAATDPNELYNGDVTFSADDVVVTVIQTGTAVAGQIKIGQNRNIDTPSRLKITVTGAAEHSEVEIVGCRKYGLGSKDIVTEKETVALDASATATTDAYFFDVLTQITFKEGHGLTTAANVEIIAEPGLRKTVFKARSAVPDGFTFQSKIGTESRLGFTGIISNANFNVSDTVRLAMDLLFRAVYRRRTVEGGFKDEVLADDSDLINDDFGDGEFFVDYGGYLKFGDDVVIFDSFDLTLNPGLQYRTGKNGERIQSGIERGDAGYEITGSIVTNFETGDDPDDVFIKWDERYRDSDVSVIELFTYFWTNEGKQYYHRIKLPNVELSASSETPVSSRGTIKENLSIRAVKDGSDEVIEWEVVDDHGWHGAIPVLTRTGAATLAHSATSTVTVKWTRNVDDPATTSPNEFVTGDVTVEDGTKGAFATVTAGDEYTVMVTAPSSGDGNIIATIAENSVYQGNPERSIAIPYA